MTPVTSTLSAPVTVVAFDAHLSHDEPDPGPHLIVAFDVVTTNIGNAYNNNNGAFTCPINGVYRFTYAIKMLSNNYGVFELVKKSSLYYKC